MMIKKTLDISIVVANYNNAPYLNDFFQSVLNATLTPKELILVDDGSTDNSLEVIEKYLSNSFIKLIKFSKNKGFAHALNKGIQLATGKYILRIDPDDIMLPDRIEKQYAFLEKNKDIDVLGANVKYFNSHTGEEIITSDFPINHKEILKAYQLGDHGVQHPTICAKAAVYKKYTYQQETYPAEDYDIFARMIEAGCKFANLDDVVNKMRVHSRSVSNHISFSTIEKTFQLKSAIFSTAYTPFQAKRYFYYITNYRKFLFSNHKVLKFFYAFVAALCYPEKLIRKVFTKRVGIPLSFSLFMVLFIADSVLNYYSRIPLFVAGGILLLAYQMALLYWHKQYDTFLIVFVASILLIGIINNMVYQFHLKNISDSFFILLFVTSYYLYKNNFKYIRSNMIWLLVIVSIELILPSFLGINKWQSTLQYQSDDIEFLRAYHQGFFRIPHIATYFFGFLFLFFSYQFQKLHDYKYLIWAIVSIFFCFYTGVRAFFAASGLALLIYLLKNRQWKLLIAPSILVILAFIYIDELLALTEGSFVFQYLTLIKTLESNITRFSRIIIWASWFKEMSSFGILDYLIGKTFISSHYTNEQNIILHPKGLWFHNDFFSILYTYGIWVLGLYIFFFIKMFRDFKTYINQNIFLYIFFLTMIISAFINGMYYYFPVFILLPFILMLNSEKNSVS